MSGRIIWTQEQKAELRRLAMASHPRYAIILGGLDTRQDWEQIAEHAGATVECVKGWHYGWKIVENGLVPTGHGTALDAGRTLRFMLNLEMTHGMRAAIDAYLLRLHEVCPEIPLRTPASPGVLGGHWPHGHRPAEPAVCASCFTIHAGECW